MVDTTIQYGNRALQPLLPCNPAAMIQCLLAAGRPELRFNLLMKRRILATPKASGINRHMRVGSQRDLSEVLAFSPSLSCAIASRLVVPTTNFSRVTTGASATFAS